MKNQLHKELTSTFPNKENLPHGSNSRLIEGGMIYYEASISGFKERYTRGKTSHTIHVWWARRPHSAMRALVFATLCKDLSPRLLNLLRELTFLKEGNEKPLKIARKELYSQYNGFPKLLDMFGGGGTIAFEAMNVGAQSFSLDSNQLAVFIQRNLLSSSQAINPNEIFDVLQKSGKNILEKLSIYTAPLFPLRKQQNIIGYVWTYSKECNKCGYRYYLIKKPWLSKKKNRNIAFIVENNGDRQKLRIENVNKNYKYPSVWKNRAVKCPKCNNIEDIIDVKQCQEEVIALIASQYKKGKEFIEPNKEITVIPSNVEKFEKDTLDSLKISLPSSEMPIWSGIVNPPLYGIKKYYNILNKRQRAVLLALINCLMEEYIVLKRENGKKTADYIISLLSSLIDQLVDWNCRISMWISQNEQVGRAFCGPGVPMYWEYVEIDPLLDGPANLWGKLNRIISGAKTIHIFPIAANVQKGYAQKLPFADSYFDAIVTDPPYYDNLYYSILADFFYIWKRPLFKEIEPELFKDEITDRERELVASSYRDGDSTATFKRYCREILLVFKEAARVLKNDGIFSFIYSHSTLNAWKAIIYAYRNSNFFITRVQPLSIERKQRPRAMSSVAVNTCMVFVARKTNEQKGVFDLKISIEKIKVILESDYVKNLISAGWHERDIAIAVFSHGVVILANHYQLKENSNADEKALIKFEKLIKERFSTFRIQKRKSL